MNLILSLAGEVAVLAAVCAAINVVILAYRNPHRSQILRNHKVEDGVAAMSILAAFMAVSMLGYGIFSLLPNLYAGGPVFLGVSILTYVLVDRAMNMSARLAICDQGNSPIESGEGAQSPLAVV